jgi:hypothetical protein
MRKLRAKGLSWTSAFLVTLATFLSVSCGGRPGISPTKTSANIAGLVFNTSSLDFGAVAIGGSRKSSITVTNSSPTGGGSVTVTKVVVTGSGFSQATPNGGFTLGPGQSATLTVTFAPKASGEAIGELSIFVSGTAETGTISLTGTTVSGHQLVVSPSKLTFGTVALGTTKTLIGRLSAGDSDVSVSSASWNGQGFAISGIQFPVTVPANDSITFSVTFTPETAGATSGGVVFVSDATNSPTTETFTGNGGAVSQASQHSVSLNWNLAAAIDGYNIYRSTTQGGPYTRLNAAPQKAASYTDGTVKSGTTYYYVATAVDSGVESGYSEEVEAVIPSP